MSALPNGQTDLKLGSRLQIIDKLSKFFQVCPQLGRSVSSIRNIDVYRRPDFIDIIAAESVVERIEVAAVPRRRP